MGFAASDWIELALAAAFLGFALIWRPWLAPRSQRLAYHTGWSMAIVAAAPVALRLALLAQHPVPVPDIYDEFGHLFVADTLRHLRLANPPHALPQFFETFFILQRPTYSSIYPIGQGLALALGWTIFGVPWAGVLISTAALCSLCYWMLRGWTTPGWALVGGMLAVFEFGPLSQWTNSYWGGGFSAAAGCLVFGALPRLRERCRDRDAALLGLGLGIHLLSRPYESIFLLASVILFALPGLMRQPRMLVRPALIASLVVTPAIGITLLQNQRVTGSWTTLPYVLSQRQYGVPATLTFQPSAVPHRTLTREQALDYEMQKHFRAQEVETFSSFFARLRYRLRYAGFFLYPPLWLAVGAFLIAIRTYAHFCVVAAVSLFVLGTNFFPAFQYHYLAAVVCLFILMAVQGLRILSRWPVAARLIVYLCVFQFGFWYAMHIFDESSFSRGMRRYESSGFINHRGDRRGPERRVEVAREVARIPGRILIFVRYWPQHIFQGEWVWNAADIDGARVVWARDLGEPENERLRRYFNDRAVYLLEPDARPPRLRPYLPESTPSVASPTDALPDDSSRAAQNPASTREGPKKAEPPKPELEQVR